MGWRPRDDSRDNARENAKPYTPCSRCGEPSDVIIVNRETGEIFGYACPDCDTHALRAGPHIDFPLDAHSRTERANRAIEKWQRNP